MKDIKDQLQIAPEDREKFAKEIKRLAAHLALREWVAALHLSEDQLEHNATLLDDVDKSMDLAAKPHAVDECPQRFKGRLLNVVISDSGVLHREYVDCSCIVAWKRENNFRSKYLIRHFADDLLETKFPPDIGGNASRAKIVNYLQEALDGKHKRGMFIAGEPGIGKSHVMIAFANAMAKRDKTVAFVLVPRLVNEIRSTFRDATSTPHDDLLAALRNADLLVLDDIGGEQVLPWFRDERLFPVLDFRMQEKKLTCFTSNLAYDELHALYAKEDRVRAIRLMDRIKALSAYAPMTGINYRY